MAKPVFKFPKIDINIMMSQKQKKVLKRITKVFRENNIPFQITGGLVAIVYASHRPLYDIDIDIYAVDIPKIRRFLKRIFFPIFIA